MPDPSGEAVVARRVFFALWPDAALQQRLADAAARHGHGGRVVPAHQLHLTLAFAGTVPAPVVEALQADAAKVAVAPFTLRLDRCGSFAAAAVQWLGASTVPPPLRDLAGTLASLLRARGIRAEGGRFVPHVTIRRRAPYRRPRPIAPLDWPARDFALIESGASGQPGAYRVLARWPLRAAEGGSQPPGRR